MKHLTLSDRIRIEALLEECKSFSQIAAEIGKSPTTISREVLRHRSVVRHYSTEMARKRSIISTMILSASFKASSDALFLRATLSSILFLRISFTVFGVSGILSTSSEACPYAW